MKRTSLRCSYLLGSLTLITLGLILVGKVSKRPFSGKLDLQLTEERLWRSYRWSIDPYRRREAALLLVSKSKTSPLRVQRLLAGQSWGNHPLASIVLNLQARNYEKLNMPEKAIQTWKKLLHRFPFHEATADSYYKLGFTKPKLRKELLRIFPAHPAALAAAVEDKNNRNVFKKSALHLARWGYRWPGAEDLIRNACEKPWRDQFLPEEQHDLSLSLALLGDGVAALNCIGSQPPKSNNAVVISELFLQGNNEKINKGKQLLLSNIKNNISSPDVGKSINLFFKYFPNQFSSFAPFAKVLEDMSPEYMIEKSRYTQKNNLEKILVKWPNYSESWQLQWELGREYLLKGNWEKANEIFEFIPLDQLPVPFASRIKFWEGFIALKQNRLDLATDIWRNLLENYPPNYYTWRASVRLGDTQASKFEEEDYNLPLIMHEDWYPLGSNYPFVNQLWRLGFPNYAWEIWRSKVLKSSSSRRFPEDKLVEARLRVAVGDNWMGLFYLWSLQLNLVGEQCETRTILHKSQYPYIFWPEIRLASLKTGLSPELILAVIKQESRFSPGVISRVGAIGLMQILPGTAREISLNTLTNKDIAKPATNIYLGSKYLSLLFDQSNRNPFISLASYNAGLRKVQEWVSLEINTDPELWVERIPYPETRFYTKKVLGDYWSYLNLNKEMCEI